MHEHLRHRLLGWWAGAICQRPWSVLVVALMVTAACVGVTVGGLAFRPDRNELISEDLDWNRRYIQYRSDFSFDDLLIVVRVPEGDDGRAQAERFVDDLASRLNADSEHFNRVVYGFQATPRMIRMAPWTQFEKSAADMRQAAALLGADNAAQFLAAVRTQWAGTSSDLSPEQAIAAITGMSRAVGAMGRIMGGGDPAAATAPLLAEVEAPWQYLTSPDARLLFIQIEPALATDELEPVRPAVEAARRIMAAALPDHPGIEAGLTGVPVIESDETDVAQQDATITSIIAVAVIAVILVIAFHSWLMPLLMVVSLLVGIAWTFGFLTLSIGYLQILSVVFTVILLGLGVDFGIHLISRFELVRQLHGGGLPGFRRSMSDTLQVVGPGIVTGAVTTAIAFGATLLTDFRGMAEMGLIAGVGILLCLIAMFTVLPALLRLTRTERDHVRPVHKRRINLYEHHWWQPFVDRPALPLTLVGLAVIGSLFALPNLRYDYNLSNLLPEGVESVKWFGIVEEDAELAQSEGAAGQGSIWFGASVVRDGMDAARQRAHALEALPSVAGVGGVAWMFPLDQAKRDAALAGVRAALGDALTGPATGQPATRQALLNELRVLGAAVGLGRQMLGEGQAQVSQALGALAEGLSKISETLAGLDEAAATQRLGLLHEQFTRWQQQTRQMIAKATEPAALALEELPDALARQARGGADGKLLLVQVYPKHNMYEPHHLKQFVQELRTVDPNVTGTVIQIYESNQLIVRSYVLAGALALAAVFVLVLLDFQSITDALLCLLPVAVAFLLLLGVMAGAGVPINPANVIVLPLLFGMGVDSGVHMMHRYRQSPDEHPPGLAGGTGKGITLTSLTTMVGFATLMLARHRGIISLGFVLAMGMALTLLTCLAVMPALLELRNKTLRWRAARRNQQAAGTKSN